MPKRAKRVSLGLNFESARLKRQYKVDKREFNNVRALSLDMRFNILARTLKNEANSL